MTEDPRLHWRRMAVLLDVGYKGATAMQDAGLANTLAFMREACVDLGVCKDGVSFPVEPIFRDLAERQGYTSSEVALD